MGSLNIIEKVVNWIINEFDSLDENNCKAIDETVFDYIQTTNGAPDHCVIVDYGGFIASREREFVSSSIYWRYYVNYFHRIPNDGTYFQAYLKGMQFVDDLIEKISKDPTLSRTVMIANVESGGSPIPYGRGSHRYVMHDAEIRILENIR